MNETFQAREGFSPDLFPPVHVFMGHYHKPHRVAGTDIRYIGSPYQGAHCNKHCLPIRPPELCQMNASLIWVSLL